MDDLGPSKRIFDEWLSRGYHGDMHYLSRTRSLRYDPGKWLIGARSAICVGLNYFVDDLSAAGGGGDERDAMSGGAVNGDCSRAPSGGARDARGIFSRYARGRDYHLILMGMLEDLERSLAKEFEGMRSLAFVDTKPVPERALALLSGMGWLGKNTCVISPGFGSWIFLGELITDMELNSDRKLESRCGECITCIEACPTGALVEPFTMDARRCISYLTIEKRGDIPFDFRRKMGRHVFGCDVCQEVCPFNEDSKESKLFSGEQNPLVERTLGELVEISDEEFKALTAGSTIRRCRADGFRRNARIALDNVSDTPSL